MKSIITAVCLLIPLIIFFVIIDRKDFYSGDELAVQQETVTGKKPTMGTIIKPVEKNAETKPTETKPVTESKPVENKMVEVKSVETKPMTETKPIAENMPTEDTCAKHPNAVPVFTAEEASRANGEALKLHPEKEIIAKKNEERYVAESTKDKPYPMAVPVLTPEEAIKANKEAIRFHRNKKVAEAFRSLCQKIGLNNNRIHCIFSLFPLLLICDVFFFRKRKKTNKNNVMDYISLSRRMRVLFSVSLLAFGILVFVPWSVYFGNSLQFPFIFQDFVNWNLRVLTISIICASIILLLIPPIVSDYLVAIIAGLGLCVYVQAMFMNQHLGTMDGIEPIWSEHRVFGTINLIIWIAIVLSSVVLRKLAPSFFSKGISIATGFVIFLELLATVSMLVSAGKGVWFRTVDTFFADGTKQFQLSKEKNVVVFIFDTLGSEYVERCLKTYPEAKEIVKDFIWYKDARANYHLTFPGLTHEMTGAMLPAPANNFYELFERMWHSTSAKSFFKQMNDSRFEARLYCEVPTFEIGPAVFYHDYFTNIQARDIIYEIDYNRLHFCLKEMSGFSSVPYFFKKYFFYAFDFSAGIVQKTVADIPSDKKWIPVTNPDFLKKMTSSGLTIDNSRPILAFYYTHGVHKPWKIDERCNNSDSQFDTPCPTTMSCFYILSEFIRHLKANNIYNNTSILICSDHGGNDTGGGGNGKYDLTFMIKPFNENKTELTIDMTKIQSIDILPTLLYMACGERANFSEFEGFAPNRIPNERVRYVYSFYSNRNLPPVDPDLDRCYPGIQGVEEYIFKDLQSFKLGQQSDSFVRIIPLVTNNQDENISK